MIKLNSLDLENFMCIKKAHLEFENQKVIILLGDNGNGKSAVLDAIALCLTESKRSNTYKEYIRRDEKSASILLRAEINSYPISFEISINQSGTALDRKVVYKKEREEPFINSEVTELLERLQLPYFGQILMSAQSEDNITKKTPAERAKYLRNLLNFSFEKQTNFCKDKLEEIKIDSKKNSDLIEFNINAIEIKKKQIKEVPTEDYMSKFNKFVEASKVIEEKLKDYKDSYKEQNDLVHRNRELLEKKSKIVSEIEYNRKCLADLPNLEKQLRTLEDDNKYLDEKIVETRKFIEDDTKSLSELINDFSKIDDSASEELTSDIIQLKSELTTVSSHIDLVNKGKCPTCGSVFSAVEAGSLNEKKEQLLEQIKVKQEEVNKARIAKNSLVAEKEKLEKSIYSYKLDIRKLEINKQSNKNKVEEINSRIAELKALSVVSFSGKEKELKALEEEEHELNTQLSTVKEKISMYQQLTADLQRAQEVLIDITKKMSEKDNIINTNKLLNDEIEILTRAIAESYKKIAKGETDEKIYKEAYVILNKKLPDYLTIKTCDLLEEEMNNFVHVVFPNMVIKLYQNKSGIEFFYTDSINTKKDEMSNAKMASGFEKDLLSLAFKVALCKLYNLSFAFFDEADGHSSDKNAEKLFKSLFTNGLFEQVFLISHKSTVKDVVKSNVDNVLVYYVKNGVFSLDSAN